MRDLRLFICKIVLELFQQRVNFALIYGCLLYTSIVNPIIAKPKVPVIPFINSNICSNILYKNSILFFSSAFFNWWHWIISVSYTHLTFGAIKLLKIPITPKTKTISITLNPLFFFFFIEPPNFQKCHSSSIQVNINPVSYTHLTSIS